MKWMLVAVIAICTALADVLNTAGMKRQVVAEGGQRRALKYVVWGIFRNRLVLCGLGLLAISFFAFFLLLSISNVSFAVPATASSYVLEATLRLHAAVTYMAKHSNANGKNPKYPGIGISKIFHCWNMGKI